MTTGLARAVLAAPPPRRGRWATPMHFDPAGVCAGRDTTSRRNKAVETTGRRTPSPALQAA